MKLNYKHLTYIIETLREAKCKAYDTWYELANHEFCVTYSYTERNADKLLCSS